MAAGAETTSRLADTFSNWMLGGFGAVLALLLSNLDKPPLSSRRRRAPRG